MRIFAIGFDLPGDEFEYFPWTSKQSLLDADIILIRPSLEQFTKFGSFEGQPLIGSGTSAGAHASIEHWRSEIAHALAAGKVVIAYMTKLEPCYYHTGREELSGTGRSQVSRNIVAPISNYSVFASIDAVAKTGSEVRVAREGQLIAPYWKEMSAHSRYEAFIDGQFTRVLLQTGSGSKTLGAIANYPSGGALVCLPPLNLDLSRYERRQKGSDQRYWNAEALRIGKRLAAILVALRKEILAGRQATPPPVWARDEVFQLESEKRLLGRKAAVEREIIKLQNKREALDAELEKEGQLRALLFEQGRPLELAVIGALQELGFAASSFAEATSEFDAVFSGPEGRFLGEVEGRDEKAINVDKLSQLERNLQEDFQRDEVTSYAKGVLFGNAYRLTPPEGRQDYFTAKCCQAAQRAGVALVRTPDLFRVVSEVRRSPAYAEPCRKAIAATAGSVVVFPDAD